MKIEDIENFTKEVKTVIVDWFQNEGFKARKLTDTPTDDLQVVNKKYVDANSGGVAGSDTQIQFNDGGVLGADSTFTYDKTTYTLTVGVGDNTTTIQSPGEGGPISIKTSDIATSGVAGTITLNPGAGKGSSNSSGDIRLTSRNAGDSNARQGRVVITNDSVFSERFTNGTSTSNATPVSTTLFTMAGTVSALVVAKVTARRVGGTAGTVGDSAAYIRKALYKTISGTTTLVGSIVDDFTAEDQAGWDCTFNISTNDIQLQVTGATDNTISWFWEIMIIHTTQAIL